MILVISFVFLAAIIGYTAWGNTALEQNSYQISSEQIPSSFDGFRIAHVSDLHNTEFGKNNEKLLSLLKKPILI
jgi:predicted MPP superfamily phosphohydrolase